MPPLVYFVRHGETDWNVESRFQGQQEVDINDKGRRQARANGLRLAGLVADPAAFDFVASPLRRTRETMEIVRSEMGLPAGGYGTDTRLVEVNFGDWEGLTIDQVEAVMPGAEARRARDKWGYLPPGVGAESYEILARRVSAWLAELVRPTVCVTHGGVIRCIFLMSGAVDRAEAEIMPVPQDRVLRFEAGRPAWI